MKKVLFACVTAATLFMSSCKKEEVKPSTNPVKTLESQTNWNVDNVELANVEMKNIISGQVGSTNPSEVYLELHLNETTTPVEQVATSTMRPSRNTGREQLLRINRISETAVAISFITKNGDPYAGSYANESQTPSQQLQELQVLDWQGGGGESYCTFSPAKHLNGIYTVEETTDGVRLSKEDEPGKKVVINLNRTLRG